MQTSHQTERWLVNHQVASCSTCCRDCAFSQTFATHGMASSVWGKNDPFFLPAGAEVFKCDIPGTDVCFFDTGHFALETHCPEIAAAIRDFLDQSSTCDPAACDASTSIFSPMDRKGIREAGAGGGCRRLPWREGGKCRYKPLSIENIISFHLDWR